MARIVKLLNRSTGEIIEVDSRIARVRRLRSRVGAWGSFVRGFMAGCVMKMVTLTYAPTADGRTAWRKQHVREFMGKVRRHCGLGLVAYAWVAELQARGEVHYHCLLVVRSGVSLPYPDRAGWWTHGMSRIETAHSPGYVIKYASKTEQDEREFPKGLRLFACWIAKEYRGSDYDVFFRVYALPSWLRSVGLQSDEWPKREPGGGWRVVLDGLIAVAKSPYVVRSVEYV